mgnify:CR=1 FL=1
MSKESFIDHIKPQIKKKKVTLYLNPETALKLKIDAAKRGKTQSRVIEEIIEGITASQHNSKTE